MDERDIFIQVIQAVDAVQGAALVHELCGQDHVLRQRVEALLDAHGRAVSFLESPPTDLAATTDQRPIAERPGTVIGPYKLLQQIGEGGMGVVFMAEQTEPLQRTVALKIIKPGMDTRQVIARFEAERQALALMDHPNIARVIDAGMTETGRPYFVMDLVKGVPITEYCDAQRLSVRQRLELFTQVCQAVQHAHQKGIIHRDLKPSNVLVAEFDGKPVPKVIDFGVAKATAQRLTERTMFTQYGQIVGTFEYMSPEQARFNQLDVDTRSDIYSLGVLLYELLAGSTPLEKERLRTAAFDEILRIIGEEEPPKPSTRLSSSQSLPSIAANRHTEPARLGKEVRGELDWIVMKCLEKDRNRRYETANGLSMDLQRYLHDEAVEACPPSAVYRFRKFARRNKAALAITGLVLVCLMFLVGGVGWVVRDRAVRQVALEQGVMSALADVESWHQRENWPEAIAAVKHAEALLAAGEPSPALNARVAQWRTDVEAATRLEEIRLSDSTNEWTRWSDLPAAHGNYRRAFRALGIEIDAMTIEEAARLIRASAIHDQLSSGLDGWSKLRRFLVVDKSELAKDKPDDWWRRPLAVARRVDTDEFRNRVRLAIERQDQAALLELAQSPDAVRLPASTLDLLVFHFEPTDISRQGLKMELLKRAQSARPDDFYIDYSLAMGRPDPSGGQSMTVVDGKFSRRATRGNDLLLGDEAIFYAMAAVALRPSNVYARGALAAALHRSGRFDDALAAYREALRLEPDNFAAYGNIGIILYQQGKLDEAVAACRKASELKPDDALANINLGAVLRDQGKLDEALAADRKAIELKPDDAKAHSNLGAVLEDQGKLDEAVAAYRRAIELDPKDAAAYCSLGDALRKLGKLDESVVACRKAVELEPDLAAAHHNLGNVLHDQGKLDEAIAGFRRAVELDPDRPLAYNNLGKILTDAGRLNEAVTAIRKAIELDPSYADAYNSLGTALINPAERADAFRRAIELRPNDSVAYTNLGGALQQQGKLDEAVAACRKAIELKPDDAPAYVNLGAALSDQGKLDEAIAACRKAIEIQPDEYRAHNNLGNALKDLGQLDEAIAAYRKVLELKPDCVAGYSNLANALSKQGHFDEALATHQKVIELEPKNPAGYNGVAWLLATAPTPEVRDPARAVELATRAVELAPADGGSWNTLGITRYRAGQWQLAIDALEKSMELRAGGDSNDWFFLAMAHWQLGRKDDARKWYDKAVEWMDKNQPKNEELDRFRAEAADLLGVTDPPNPKPSTLNPKP